MDRPEELAQNYLIKLGFNPKYEPLGRSTCPDFEIRNSTAVEVRRLNKNYFGETQTKDLRSTSYPIFQGIKDIFKKHQKATPTQNFWVSLRIKRPTEKLKTVKKELNSILSDLIKQDIIKVKSIDISPSVELKLMPKVGISNQIFHLGSLLDFDSVGYVIPNLIQNLNYCIEQKTEVIKKCLKHYESWWLVLVDEISYGLDENEKSYIRDQVIIPTIWDKVITLNTLNGKEILKI